MRTGIGAFEDTVAGICGAVGIACLLSLVTRALSAARRLLLREPLRLRGAAGSPVCVPNILARGIWLLAGSVMVLASASAQGAIRLPGRRPPQGSRPPWSETSGSPPPHSLVRATPPVRDLTMAGGKPDAPVANSSTSPLFSGNARGHTDGRLDPDDGRSYTHPALHGRPQQREGPVTVLFPRERRPAPFDKRRAQRAHPSFQPRTQLGSGAVLVYPGDQRKPHHSTKKNGSWSSCRSSHIVAPRESLWTIAAGALGTRDVVRIARYWPVIYLANRDVIGANPDLIRPGQVLTLPRECG